MLIGIDGNEANVEKKVGISEFAYELLCELHKIQSARFKIYLKYTPRSEMPEKGLNWQYHVFGPSKLWTQWRLPLDLFITREKPAVFFSPSHYAPRISPIPTVVSVMDLSYLYFPELFKKNDLYQLIHWTSYSVRNARRIITISKSSKDDIIKKYKIDTDKVVVVYPGIKKSQETTLSMEELAKKYNIDTEFILFVGTLQPRKNLRRLIEAFSKLKKKDIDLVVIGKKGWLYDDILISPEKYGVDKRVKFLDYVQDHDLPAFYKKAVCFVLPSLYEGFGLPVLEAMRYGCPVLTSNISSLPEAGGDAAQYFDPENTKDITRALDEVIGSKKLQETMQKKGYQQVKKFSWEKAAAQTLEVLDEVARGS